MRLSLLAAIVAAILRGPLMGQAFSSGSNGSDGALNFSTPGTFVFDPSALNIDRDGDGIFHFTTITVGSGVTLLLRSGPLRGLPVIWLATGPVQVQGVIDLSGQPGYSGADPILASRAPAEGGPGGYPGGVGADTGSPAQAGAGPGGGSPSPQCNFCVSPGGEASHATLGAGGLRGALYGAPYLVPLRGGSGGGGAAGCCAPRGGGGGSGGGGGGGALRVVSSVSISVSGSIVAFGGAGGAGGNNISPGGAGSGGAIHLIAPQIAGAGGLRADTPSAQGLGRIRLDAYQQQFTGSSNPTASLGTPYSIPLPSHPTVRVTSIAGIVIAASPTGSFAVPDVVINQPLPVPIAVEGRNIPLTAAVRVYLVSENAPDQVLTLPALTGNAALSTSSVNATFPAGFSRGYVRATW